jgi:periplasmic copper chaperone A
MNRKMMMVCLLILLVACGPRELTLKDAWARPALAGNNSAVYLVINNSTGEDDTLLSVSTEAARTVEMHMTVAVEGEHSMEHDMEHDIPQGEVLRMVQQESVPVPGEGKVEFAPGGLHIMLVGVNSDLAAGDTIEVTFTFEKAGLITLQVTVEES